MSEGSYSICSLGVRSLQHDRVKRYMCTQEDTPMDMDPWCTELEHRMTMWLKAPVVHLLSDYATYVSKRHGSTSKPRISHAQLDCWNPSRVLEWHLRLPALYRLVIRNSLLTSSSQSLPIQVNSGRKLKPSLPGPLAWQSFGIVYRAQWRLQWSLMSKFSSSYSFKGNSTLLRYRGSLVSRHCYRSQWW